MANKIKIISDSTCDLSKELIKKYDIPLVPLFVNFGEESYLDGETLTTVEMYQKVEEKDMLPKTAAASPGSFVEVFEKYLSEGYEVIYIGLGSKFSATFQSAHSAKLLLENEKIYLIDSGNLSSGSGLLVMKALSFREQGDSAKEIVEKIEALVPKVRSQFVIETLEYLYKGGRLNALSAFMGTMLRLKPIIKVRNGIMEVGKKGRGKLRNGIDLMLEEVINQKEEIDLEFCMITHSLSDEAVPYIRENINGIPFKNVFETEAGCVISSHCGKGTIGILYILK